MSKRVIPVILSGGSGTRLWPLSTATKPKQFLPLVGTETLFQQTLLRLDDLPVDLAPPIVVCNESHRELVAEQLAEIGRTPLAVVLEPVGRNTAPAVAVAAMLANSRAKLSLGAENRAVAEDSSRQSAEASSDPVLLVLPADHVILDTGRFQEAVKQGLQAAEAGYLVTFGVVPTRPETGYGYIEHDAAGGSWLRVAKFVEKPELETAKSYLESGRYLWNSGMFVFSAGTYLSELGRHAPDILAQCENALADAGDGQGVVRLGSGFAACRSESIDYAVMERTDHAVLVPLDAGWSDVGSWAALYDVLSGDADGNVMRGRVAADGCRGTHLVASSRLVVAVGLEDIVVVETADAVLVMPRDQAQAMKRLVEGLDDESD